MKKERKMQDNKPMIIFFTGFFAIVIVFSVCYSIAVAEKEEDATGAYRGSASVTEAPVHNTDEVKIFLTNVNAVIKTIDPERMQIGIIDADSDEEILLSYTGATDIRDAYDKVISARQLDVGGTALVTYDTSTCVITAVKESEGFFEYKSIKNIIVSKSEKRMYFLEKVYEYTDKLLVITGEEGAGLDDILPTDIVTVRGTGNKVCSITVTKGHGYITLSNDDYFIGGSLHAGAYNTYLIEEGMKIALPEGTYDFMVESVSASGNKELKIVRNEVTEFNLTEFTPEPVKKGKVAFDITPAEAELYVDGEFIFAHDDFELSYGMHDVEVTLGGYSSYTGTITIDKTDNNYSVTLYPGYASGKGTGSEDISGGEADLENGGNGTGESTGSENSGGGTEGNSSSESSGNGTEGNSSSGSSDSGTGGNNGSGNSDSGTGDNENTGDGDSTSESTIKVDNDHTITIVCNEGTEVYFNNQYVGVIEEGSVVIPKYIGTFEVVLYLAGYEMQSFTVSVRDDNENVEFSFPEF